jgi:NTE family protein
MPAEAAVLRSDGRGAALAPLAQLALQWTRWLSPAQANPLDLNPLREVVNRRFDFERLRRESPLRLCISATEVATGAARCFSERDLSADALLASACLPSLFRPVVIAGEALWDGGYSANPPVQALLASTQARHTLLVLLNPQRHPHTPTSAENIRAHAQDLGFSAGLEAELRTLAQWQDDALAPSGWQVWRRWSQGPATQRLSGARFHCIDGGQALADWHPTSRLAVHAEHFEQLFRLGREHAQAWLAQALGPKGLSGRRLSALWAPPAGAPGAR